jgi:hypothetical protein
VTLGLQEIAIPFLQLPEILAQYLVHLPHIALMQLSCLDLFYQGQNGQDQGRGIHFEGVLIYELGFRHQGTHLESSDLLATNPAHKVDLTDPVEEEVDGEGWVVVH